jgi:hypothetical protein
MRRVCSWTVAIHQQEDDMAHIPMDDVQQLFGENKQKSWMGFQQILKQHKGKTDAIEDSIVDSLMMVTRRLEQSKEPYPHTPEQMQRVLENEMSKAMA